MCNAIELNDDLLELAAREILETLTMVGGRPIDDEMLWGDPGKKENNNNEQSPISQSIYFQE